MARDKQTETWQTCDRLRGITYGVRLVAGLARLWEVSVALNKVGGRQDSRILLRDQLGLEVDHTGLLVVEGHRIAVLEGGLLDSRLEQDRQPVVLMRAVALISSCLFGRGILWRGSKNLHPY